MRKGYMKKSFRLFALCLFISIFPNHAIACRGAVLEQILFFNEIPQNHQDADFVGVVRLVAQETDKSSLMHHQGVVVSSDTHPQLAGKPITLYYKLNSCGPYPRQRALQENLNQIQQSQGIILGRVDSTEPFYVTPYTWRLAGKNGPEVHTPEGWFSLNATNKNNE